MKPTVYGHESEQKHEIWCRRLLNITWLCLLVAVLIDTITILSYTKNTATEIFYREAIIYIIHPGLINISLLGITHLLSYHLFSKKQYSAQAVLYVTCVSLICAVFVWVNSTTPIIYSLFAIPIFLSLLYINQTALLYAFLLNLVLFFLHNFIPFHYPNYANVALGFINNEIAFAIIVVSYLVSIMILKRQQDLIQDTLSANKKSKLDSLTGLYNHASFYEQLDQHIQDYNAERGNFCLVIIDIDEFKNINDTYGHNTGDEVLRILVKSINSTLPKEAGAFRYGGEEFTILIKCNVDKCMQLTDSILKEFKHLTQKEILIPVTASAGICFYDAQRFGAKREFFAAADEALYIAKRSGKDTYVVWNDSLRY